MGVTGLVAYGVSKFSSGRAIVIITALSLLGFLVALALVAVRAKGVWPAVKAVAVALLAVALGAYLILFLLVFFFQDTLANETNTFFQPRSLSAEAAAALASSDVEPIEFATPDGAMLRGWLVKNSGAERAPLVIYFDGSGSEASQMIPYVRAFDGWSVALVNYRGFGQSTGTPSQKRALADAALIYDALTQRPDVDSERVIAMGYSLGTGVAVDLAAQRPVAGVVLVAPYDSMSLIGLKQSPLFAPLSGIMHRYFDSMSWAPSISAPVLVLIGASDAAVPPALSQRLAAAWGGEATVEVYEGENHDLLLHDNDSWSDIAAFLNNSTSN
jgi:hypothetical protein